MQMHTVSAPGAPGVLLSPSKGIFMYDGWYQSARTLHMTGAKLRVLNKRNGAVTAMCLKLNAVLAPRVDAGNKCLGHTKYQQIEAGSGFVCVGSWGHMLMRV